MNTLHANFNGGLMTERLAGRFDLDKFRTCAKQMQNMMPSPYGGVFKRPGISVGTWLGNSARSKAITFRRSVDQSSILIFGDGWARSEAALTTLEVAWATGRKYLVGDVVTISGTPNLQYYCTTEHTAGATFAGDSANWYQLTNAITGNNFGSLTITANTSVHFPIPYTAVQTFEVKYEQANDVMFLAHPSHLPYRLSFRGDSYGRYDGSTLVAGGNWIMEPVPFQFAPALDINKTATAVQIQYSNIPRWAASWVTGTAYKVGDRVQRTVSAPIGGIYECINDHTAGATFAGDVANWTLISSAGYVVGDRVTAISGTYEGQIFTCHTAHGGGTADAVDAPGTGSAWATYWNLGTSSTTIAGWAANTSYVAGNRVQQNRVIYECIANHKASAPISGRYGRTGGNQPAIGATWTLYWRIVQATTKLEGVSFKLVATEDTFSANDVNNIWTLEIGTTGLYEFVSTASGTNVGPTEPLFLQGGFLVTTNWNTSAAMVGTLTLEESFDGVNWSQLKNWYISNANEGNISYEGTAPDVGAWYRISATRTSGGTGGVFQIEPVSSLIKIPFKITAYTSAKEVAGYIITQNDNLPPSSVVGVSTTSYRKPAFSPTEGYPRAVCFHDGRLWFAGTNKQKARIWGSKLDDFYNFLTGSLDDSGIDVTLGATEGNDILWLASHNRAMVVGTSGQEWTLDSGDAETIVTPTKARARARTRYGSADIAPQPIAESLLFFARSGASVREFTYSFQLDGFTAPDLTQLIGGLLYDGEGVRCAAYTAVPFPVLWVVGIRGNLWSFIYDREQNVVAWAEHTLPSGDRFWSVAAGYNAALKMEFPVFTVQKTVNGIRNYAVATMSLTAWTSVSTDYELYLNPASSVFGDGTMENEAVVSSYSTASGNTTAIISGLHLIGRSVRAFDGYTYSNPVTVTGSGTITQTVVFTGWTPAAGITSIAIGEVINSTLQAFPLDVMLQDGTGQGHKWRTNRAQLMLHRSQFGEYSDTPNGDFYPIEYANSNLFTGRNDIHIAGDWADTTQFTIRHNTPGLFGLLGYIMKSEVSGS